MRFETKVLAGSIALALTQGAQAGALGAANEIFIGGATAPQNFLREDLLIRICDGTPDVYVDQVAALPTASTILAYGDQLVVRCTTKASIPGAPALQNQDVAFYKYNGGSATGVAPVADPAGASLASKQYLDATATPGTCVSQGNFPIIGTARTYNIFECGTTDVKSQDPDAGISDVEPTLFVDTLALEDGEEPLGVDSEPTNPFTPGAPLQVKPGPGLIFGTAVSLHMYDELQEDQLAAGLLPACEALVGGTTLPARGTAGDSVRDTVECMPSLPAQLIRSVYLGQVTSWADFRPYGLTLDPARVDDGTGFGGGSLTGNDGNDVHVCQRTRGSGTHAQASVFFAGTNCRRPDNFSFIPQNNGFASAELGVVGVYANSGSSDMSDCLDALGNGAGFDGDFDGLPPTSFPNTGDSTVVPGTGLAAVANPDDPFGRPFNTPTNAYAMGYNSAEKNTGLVFDYRFVKVDGAAPTLQDTIAGLYKDVYYLSFQNREDGAGKPDLRSSAEDPNNLIRTVSATPSQVNVAEAYFDVWNAIDPAAVKAVNDTLVVDPDGVPGSGDEWEPGFVTPVAGADPLYVDSSVSDPETPFARQDSTGAQDSCQDLGLIR